MSAIDKKGNKLHPFTTRKNCKTFVTKASTSSWSWAQTLEEVCTFWKSQVDENCSLFSQRNVGTRGLYVDTVEGRLPTVISWHWKHKERGQTQGPWHTVPLRTTEKWYTAWLTVTQLFTHKTPSDIKEGWMVLAIFKLNLSPLEEELWFKDMKK